MLEASPVDKPERSHDDFMFFGSRSLYEQAGAARVVRRSPTRVGSVVLCALAGLADGRRGRDSSPNGNASASTPITPAAPGPAQLARLDREAGVVPLRRLR